MCDLAFLPPTPHSPSTPAKKSPGWWEGGLNGAEWRHFSAHRNHWKYEMVGLWLCTLWSQGIVLSKADTS